MFGYFLNQKVMNFIQVKDNINVDFLASFFSVLG